MSATQWWGPQQCTICILLNYIRIMNDDARAHYAVTPGMLPTAKSMRAVITNVLNALIAAELRTAPRTLSVQPACTCMWLVMHITKSQHTKVQNSLIACASVRRSANSQAKRSEGSERTDC